MIEMSAYVSQPLSFLVYIHVVVPAATRKVTYLYTRTYSNYLDA